MASEGHVCIEWFLDKIIVGSLSVYVHMHV